MDWVVDAIESGDLDKYFKDDPAPKKKTSGDVRENVEKMDTLVIDQIWYIEEDNAFVETSRRVPPNSYGDVLKNIIEEEKGKLIKSDTNTINGK